VADARQPDEVGELGQILHEEAEEQPEERDRQDQPQDRVQPAHHLSAAE
jgi:hypothetical protein